MKLLVQYTTRRAVGSV